MGHTTVLFKKYGIVTLLVLYYIFSVCYTFSPFSNPTEVGLITFFGETVTDILICMTSIQLYRKTDDDKRHFFGIMALSYFCAIVADSTYNLILNILGHSTPSTLISSIYEIPFLAFLILQVRIWWNLFVKANADSKNIRTPLLAYKPFIASSVLVITIFLYFADWKLDRLSGEGLYQFSDIIADAAGFALVSICLGISKNKAISCIATGFLIIVCSNYMIRLSVLALANTQNNPFEFTWIAGQILVLLGLTHLKQDQPSNTSKNWCYSVNCLQSQISIGNFGLVMLAIAIFSFFVKYITNTTSPDNSILKYLPSMMVVLSIITVFLSAYFSKKLLKPLKELEKTIECYSVDGKSQPLLKSHNDYGIREYIELKNFIEKALVSLNEQVAIERETSDLAAGVAHDIASPLATMEILLQTQSEQLSSNVKSLLKNSIQEIRNVSQKLLEKYRNPTNPLVQIHSHIRNLTQAHPVLLQPILEWVISQKRLEWSARPCDVSLIVQLGENTGWVSAQAEDLRRVISNLLNNAYESLQTKRQINVTLRTQQNSLLSLLIADTGYGMTQDQITRALEGESFKHPGRGLGLTVAKTYLKSLGGELLLTSEIGKGTQIELQLPTTSSPL